MESHNFSEPRLVKHNDNNNNNLLTWEVDLLRRGQIVDTLQVNAHNLPPRRNKKKIAWQLPSQKDQLPRFGEPEKERLWELFKQQKKERRKKAKQSGGGKDSTGEPDNDDSNEYTESTLETPAVPTYQNGLENDDNQNKEQTRKEEQPVNAPPGFATSSGTLPPPPPGFTADALQSPTPAASNDKVSEIANDPTVESHNATSTEVPSLSPEPVGSSSTSNGFPDTSSSSLGAHVATILIESLVHHQMDRWLSYFVPDAPSTLLVGQAQAQCITPTERRHQWTALQQPSWDCQGWTMQHAASGGLLLVLTGRTVQPTGPFSYNLTLILTSQRQISNSILSLSLLTV